MRKNDVTGKRFGRLVAMERHVFTKPNGSRSSRYICQCDCGKKSIVDLGNLTQGGTKSCGCFRRDETSCHARLPDEHVALRQIWNYYRRNARMRGIAWSLSVEEFTKLVLLPCNYCGVVGANKTKIRSFTHNTETIRAVFRNNGIDRIDNESGYSFVNCVTACKRCNQAKNDMTKNEFMEWVSRVYQFNHEPTR